MISEWFFGLVASLQGWLLGLFGTADPPAWISSVAGFFTDLATRTAGLGAWLPLGLLGVVSVWLLGAWFTFWIVKGIRWLWGLGPRSGGS